MTGKEVKETHALTEDARETDLSPWRPDPDGQLPLDVPVAVQHTWHRLTRRTFTSLALVPVDSGVRALGLARNFGQLASQEPDARVLVVDASLRECWTPGDTRPAPAAEIWTFLAAASTASAEASALPFAFLEFGNLDRAEALKALASAQRLIDAVMRQAAYRRCIFAVDDVVSQPEVAPLVRAVDIALICVARGASTLAATRRAVELFGRDKIAGAVLLDPPAAARS